MTSRTLSSTAFRTYWLGRYLERTGSTARLISVNASLLIDLPVRLPLGWLPMIDILSQKEQFHELYGEPDTSDPRKGGKSRAIDAYEASVNRYLLSDTRNSGSLINSLNFAKENARTLRSNLPRATFEHINGAYLYAKEMLAPPLSRTRRTSALQHIVGSIQQIDGFLSANMLHNENWQFLRLGNFMERADMTTRTIDLRTKSLLTSDTDLEPFEDIQWRSILRSMYAMQNYTVTVQHPINQADVLEFLFKNTQLPRSLLYCFSALRNCLRSLPKNTEPLERIGKMRRQLQRANVRRLEGEALHKYINARQKQLDALHQAITKTYFPSN
jgi:uncharacterized alpha-E superfamily protein